MLRIWCIKYIPSRGHYYHAFFDFTQKKSVKVRLYCLRIICSDHWSGDIKTFLILSIVLSINCLMLKMALKIQTTCLIGRTIGRTVVQRNSRQERSRWSVKTMVENKSPAAKGKFLLLSDLHHIQEGM